MTDLLTPQNVIGGIMTGIFGLMWWDIRRIRCDIDEKLNKKLDINTHELICKNSGLLVAAMVEQKLNERHEKDKADMKEFKSDILSAIKNGGGPK